jgi:hypothetical protein
MFGQLISSGIKIVTLPIDATNAGLDVLAGGNGSKRSRLDCPNPLSLAEEIRDAVADAAESIDN